jgi:hypothetical protein
MRVSGHVAGHELPVDQVPERFQVLRAGVAVVDVVGVLPDVDGQQRRDAFRQRAAGVAGVVDGDGAVGLLYQPGPAGAEVVDRGVGELLLEVREGAEGALIASARAPVGSPPPFGDRQFQ